MSLLPDPSRGFPPGRVAKVGGWTPADTAFACIYGGYALLAAYTAVGFMLSGAAA